VKLPNGFVGDVLDEQRFRLAEGDGLSGFNVSRAERSGFLRTQASGRGELPIALVSDPGSSA